VTGLLRWLVCAAAVLAIGAGIALGTAGCSTCDSPPADYCFPPPGATHQEACAACGASYNGCKDGEWVTVSCGASTPPLRDAGR